MFFRDGDEPGVSRQGIGSALGSGFSRESLTIGFEMAIPIRRPVDAPFFRMLVRSRNGLLHFPFSVGPLIALRDSKSIRGNPLPGIPVRRLGDSQAIRPFFASPTPELSLCLEPQSGLR